LTTVSLSHRRPLAARLGPPLVAGLLLACAFVGLFTAAVHAPRPNGVGVAVVAPPPMERQLDRGLDRAVPGGFDLERYRSAPAARRALLDQRVSGVLVVAGARPTLLVASAAGAPTAEAVRGTFAAAFGRRLAVVDARPLPANDGRGLSAFFLVAGTTVASVLFGALLFFFARGVDARVRVGALIAFAGLAGLVVALTADVVVGALTGAFLAVAGLTALLALAVAAPTAALTQLLGLPGVGLSALVLMLVALPSSGGPVGAQLMPGFYETLAHALPGGAALTALRSAVYFDGAAIWGLVAVLGAWAVAGLVVELAAAGRRQREAA
jgi:hypothetical protein